MRNKRASTRQAEHDLQMVTDNSSNGKAWVPTPGFPPDRLVTLDLTWQAWFQLARIAKANAALPKRDRFAPIAHTKMTYSFYQHEVYGPTPPDHLEHWSRPLTGAAYRAVAGVLHSYLDLARRLDHENAWMATKRTWADVERKDLDPFDLEGLPTVAITTTRVALGEYAAISDPEDPPATRRAAQGWGTASDHTRTKANQAVNRTSFLLLVDLALDAWNDRVSALLGRSPLAEELYSKLPREASDLPDPE